VISSITGCEIEHIENPREEKEIHGYRSKNEKLKALGYDPKWNFKDELEKLIGAIKPFKDKIDKSTIYPTVKWKP
jgi:UDP-sulfoquinovose synthase